MKTRFAVLLSASVLIAAPVQAQEFVFPITAEGMLPFCKTELAQARFGRCTGYVVAIYDEMKSRSLRTLIQVRRGHTAEELKARGACFVLDMDLSSMRQVVINWIEQYLRQHPGTNPSMYEMTIDALRNKWGCSTPAPLGFLP
jgi:hypothetical protein